MAVALVDEEDVVETALKNLNDYLHKYLRVDTSLISGLKRKQLLDDSNASQLDALVRGGGRAVDGLLDYMSSYYDEEMLEKFCSFLDESSKSAKPRFRKIAQKIRDELKKLQPTPTPPAQTERDDDSQPAVGDLPSSPPTTQGESTSAVSTGDERSQKIEEIVEIYRNNNKVCLPRFKQLEDDFETVMGQLASKLNQSSADLIIKLHTIIRMKYRQYIHGVQAAPLPDVPVTAGGLLDFIAEKSNALEILLVHRAVDVLECRKLKDDLEEYKGKLAKHLERELLSFKSRGVALPSRKDYTHMAIGLRKEKDQVFLSLVLHIKEYLMEILHLEEALFEGFAGGCTVLFFSILRIDAVLLSPKIISHLSELKRKFEIAHLVVFGYFACDLEQASVEVLSEGDDLRLELKEAEEKSEQLQYELTTVKSEGEKFKHDAIAAKMKLQLKEKELTEAKKMTVNLSEQITKLKSEGHELRLELKEVDEKAEQLRYDLKTAKSKGEKFEQDAIAAEMKLKLKEKALTEANKMTDIFSEQITMLKSEGDDLRLKLKETEKRSEQLQHELTTAKSKGEKLQHELTEAEKDRDMFRNSTVKLAEQKSKLERQIVNVKGSLCKDHLETIEDIKRSLEETASSLPDVLQVEKALLSASEKFTEDLSTSKVKLEGQLSFSKEELSSLHLACKDLEDVPSPTEEQKEILSGHKVKMESLESTVSSVQLEYDKVVLKLKCCEMDVLRELPLKEEIGYMLQERTEKIEAIMSTLKAKQEKLERDEYLHEVMEREKREALLKEENEKLKADLEHQHEDLSDRHMKLSHQHEELKLEHAHNIAKYEETIEKNGQEIKELKSELERMSKENSELRLLLEKEGQHKSEPNEENRTSTISKDDSQRSVSELSREERRVREERLELEELLERSRLSSVVELELSERSRLSRRGYYEPRELKQVDANKELQKKGTNGEHLVWKEGKGNPKLGIWQDGTCYHLQIHQKQDEASRASYSLDEKVYFDSIRELCDHYKDEPLPGCSFKLHQRWLSIDLI